MVNVIDAIIAGTNKVLLDDDLEYAIDLGLVSSSGPIAIANPLYQEIISRSLVKGQQRIIPDDPSDYKQSDGSLDTTKLFQGFVKFYQRNAEPYFAGFAFKESAPHLLLMAFLQKIVNGGASVQREYALGNRRVDLFVESELDRIVIETKIYRDGKTEERGLEQTADYMALCSATEGHLVIIDLRKDIPADEKVYSKVIPFQEIDHSVMIYSGHNMIITNDMIREWDINCKKIDTINNCGTKVLVFCNNGYQRSIPFLCYYLLKYHPEECATLTNALNIILLKV